MELCMLISLQSSLQNPREELIKWFLFSCGRDDTWRWGLSRPQQALGCSGKSPVGRSPVAVAPAPCCCKRGKRGTQGVWKTSWPHARYFNEWTFIAIQGPVWQVNDKMWSCLLWLLLQQPTSFFFLPWFVALHIGPRAPGHFVNRGKKVFWETAAKEMSYNHLVPLHMMDLQTFA